MNLKSKSVWLKAAVVASILIIITIVFQWRLQKEPKYYYNPHVVYGEKISNDVEVTIGDYKVYQSNSKLHIENDIINVELIMPYDYDIKSIHLSHDKRYLAFDATLDKALKIFVVDVNAGEYKIISDSITHQSYNYGGYEAPYGLAWSPKQNIIAFVGGCKVDGDPSITSILLYHLDMDLERQLPFASPAYTGIVIHGAKWDVDGKSIYYVVDSFGDENKYSLYQIQIETERILAGGRLDKIDRLTDKELKKWLSN